MNQNEKRFDFHGLGLALKKAREEKTKCDAGGSSLQEFTKWLKES